MFLVIDMTIIKLGSKKRFRWDLLIIFIALYNSITIPINIAFNPEILNSAGMTVLESLLDICFFVDIFFNFRTTFVSEKTGDEIRDPHLIAKKYVTSGRLL